MISVALLLNNIWESRQYPVYWYTPFNQYFCNKDQDNHNQNHIEMNSINTGTVVIGTELTNANKVTDSQLLNVNASESNLTELNSC